MFLRKERCSWTSDCELMQPYHDTEWGVPLHDDQKLFEFMDLGGFQAGLSWSTVLKKRNDFRLAFDDFDPVKIRGYGEQKKGELMQNKGIIRNKQKINATIINARLFQNISDKYGSFDKYIWQFTKGTPLHNRWKTHTQLPSKTPESEKMSKALVKEGFRFVGPTICYAFMQAAGMVNDHLISCFRYEEIKRM